MMTGFLLLFTGRLVPITQQTGGTCVAHAISACESIYHKQISPQSIIDKLGIGLTGGYDITKLPQTRLGVSKLYTGIKSDYIRLFNSGPLLIGIPKGYV